MQQTRCCQQAHVSTGGMKIRSLQPLFRRLRAAHCFSTLAHNREQLEDDCMLDALSSPLLVVAAYKDTSWVCWS